MIAAPRARSAGPRSAPPARSSSTPPPTAAGAPARRRSSAPLNTLKETHAMIESKGKAFRRLLKAEPYVFTGGVYSPLDAQIAEKVGIKAIYLSGYSVAMANGWPDMGFLTQTEVARIASMVAGAVDVPVIADADDGYGNALSTMRTVQGMIKNGVGGLHLQDQRLPKRRGPNARKVCGRPQEALGQYRAAHHVGH